MGQRDQEKAFEEVALKKPRSNAVFRSKQLPDSFKQAGSNSDNNNDDQLAQDSQSVSDSLNSSEIENNLNQFSNEVAQQQRSDHQESEEGSDSDESEENVRST